VTQTASRWDIGAIVARESAETLAGDAKGLRVAATRRLLRPVAHLLARRFVEYDSALGDRGPVRGSQWIVDHVTGGILVEGAANVPATGATLIVANHPGLADAVALLASMRRDDVWIVAADYPVLRALRRAKERFLFVDDRCAALRNVVRRLRSGDAVLLFPAGGLEPDPANAPADARASLGSWSESVELIARLVPEVAIVPAVVRGAVSRAAFANPLAMRRTPVRERQRVASLLQLAFAAYQHERVTIRFGEALRGRADARAAVLARMTALMGGAL
jgi:1-acyl-sn-glycerol-3-phosphate acyltransferase